jgi:hypothetical protein
VTEPEAGLAPVAPRYGQASLADVLPAVLASLGVVGAGDPLGLSTGALAGVTRVAVLLVDGLGHHQLPLTAPHAPTLADLVDGRLPGATTAAITAGFPSTTPTSLASLGTGAPPGAHGVVGFTVKVPGTLRVLNHIEWWDDPDPLRWQPLQTQFDRAAAAGVAVRVVSRPEFEGSGLTVAAYRGGAYQGAADGDAAAAAMLAALTDGDGPTLVYGYHPEVDKAGHVYGVDSPQWREAVADVDRLLTRLVDGLPAGAALVVTADHGQLNVPATHRFDLDRDRRLRSGVWAVAGEPRVRYLHTRRRAVADVVATWRGVLGDAAWVAPREEVVAAGWFGPISEDHLRRVGDVVVVCRDRYAVLATRSERPTVATLIAYHGSTTALEMMIPLLVVRR